LERAVQFRLIPKLRPSFLTLIRFATLLPLYLILIAVSTLHSPANANPTHCQGLFESNDPSDLQPKVLKTTTYQGINITKIPQDVIDFSSLNPKIQKALQHIIEKTVVTAMREQAFWTIKLNSEVYILHIELPPLEPGENRLSVNGETSYNQLLDFLKKSPLYDIQSVSFFHTHPLNGSPISEGDVKFIQMVKKYLKKDIQLEVSASIYAIDFSLMPVIYRVTP